MRDGSPDHSEPYKRVYNSDSDWRNKPTSSQERSAPDKRQRTLEDDDQYRYHHNPEDSYRQSPEKYPLKNKNFKGTMSNKDGYNSRRTLEDSRYNQPQDQFHYSEYKKDSHYRPVSEYYKDRDSRERSRSPGRTRTREDFIKGYSPLRSRSDSFSQDHEDRNHNRAMYSLNGPSRLHEPSHRRLSPPPPPPPPPIAAAGEKKMSKGFQRFLDVLNMGVNMETLTQIVTQGSPEENVHQRLSPPRIDRPWTAEPSQTQNSQKWSQTETRHQRQSSSYSSNGKAILEESPLESRHFEKKFPISMVNTPSSEEEHKRKQMNDVLQAIGIKLEFEELGQMSNRIQERLYGKKQPEIAPPNQKEEEERVKRRQTYIPKRRSRSSSDSSSGGSCQNYKKSHSYNAQRKDKDFPYQKDDHGTQQSGLKYCPQVVPPAPPHRQPNQIPLIPPPSPIANSPSSAYLPPNLPFAIPNMFMPPPPPFPPPYLPGLPVPPPNIFQTTGSQSAPVPQPPTKNRRSYGNLITVPTKK